MPDPTIAPFETAFAHSVVDAKYMAPHGETHWFQTADRAVDHPMDALDAIAAEPFKREREAIRALVRDRRFMPGGRYLYASGNDFHQVQNCLLLRAEDSREGWADLSWKAEMSLLTGAGIGVYWGDIRPNGTVVKRTGGKASGPVPKMIATNEQGRAAVQGGDRRAAIWAGLPWFHPDVFWFMSVKDWPQYLKDAKAKDPSVPAPMDMTNISVCLDDAFFAFFEGNVERGSHYLAMQAPEWMRDGDRRVKPEYATAPDGTSWSEWARYVYWTAVESMTTTGEPGFTVDTGEKWNEKLRNACTEIVSEDDSDICNLGGLVLSRFDTPEEFGEAVRLSALYLLAGTIYSDVPYEAVKVTRDKNRRLGLDVMGVHEFLLKRGLRYGSDEGFAALEPYMAEYEKALGYSWEYADALGISRPVAATSGAPTGTRAIGAETTTGWQSIHAAAYKRSVITSHAHQPDERTEHYIVDPTVERLLREGYILPTEHIDDSTNISYEDLFRVQAFAQSHTDQAISMTLNLPHIMDDADEQREFGETLMRYLPRLRGTTVYPDGAISGQPITPVPLSEAMGVDHLVQEDEANCTTGSCGI